MRFSWYSPAFCAPVMCCWRMYPAPAKRCCCAPFPKPSAENSKRIQFTPDLLPSDLTGINFYNQKTGDFQFREGPLFSNIILADEINRATPRTQSSLLEAMEERQISVDGTTTQLEEPFMVMATQNPLEKLRHLPAAGSADRPLLYETQARLHEPRGGAFGHPPSFQLPDCRNP